MKIQYNCLFICLSYSVLLWSEIEFAWPMQVKYLCVLSPPLWVCWHFLPNCVPDVTGGCTLTMLYENTLRLNHTFTSAGVHCLDISIRNDISKLQTSFSLNVKGSSEWMHAGPPIRGEKGKTFRGSMGSSNMFTWPDEFTDQAEELKKQEKNQAEKELKRQMIAYCVVCFMAYYCCELSPVLMHLITESLRVLPFHGFETIPNSVMMKSHMAEAL